MHRYLSRYVGTARYPGHFAKELARWKSSVVAPALEILVRSSSSSDSYTALEITPQRALSWYSCGPTVYDSAHLGHARTYVCTDIIRRILTSYFHVPVNFALGITDIDDKIINRAQEMQTHDGPLLWEDMCKYGKKFEDEFFADMQTLNVLPPHSILRVSEHMPQIEEFIEVLKKNDKAYETEDGVYFDVKGLGEEYGKLGNVPPLNGQNGEVDTLEDANGDEGPTAGLHYYGGVDSFDSHWSNLYPSDDGEVVHADNEDQAPTAGLHYYGGVDSFDSHWPNLYPSDDGQVVHANNADNNSNKLASKRYDRDFSLWKAAKPSEPFYSSASLGDGRPGWHIECSSMSMHYFGYDKMLDIHSGGTDLKFPHHTNEIAQSEAHRACQHCDANGKEDWVKVWMHTGHLYIDGLKMSKSLKNFITINDYLQQAESTNVVDDFRIFCLQHKYHSSLHFSQERVAQATAYREKIKNFLFNVKSMLQKDVSGDKSRKPTEHSQALIDALMDTQLAVKQAFGTDFDTPAALGHISKLIKVGNDFMVKAEKDEEAVLDPLVHAADYINHIFDVVGVQELSSITVSSSNTTAADSLLAANAIMDEYMVFRSTIRSMAITEMKKSKKMKKAGEVPDIDTALSDLLGECDRQRDEVAAKLGVKISDSGDAATWRPL